MKLWKLSQVINDGYDTYDSCVVVADTEEEARKIHPCHLYDSEVRWYITTWALPKDVTVEYLGETERNFPNKVICASFNAG